MRIEARRIVCVVFIAAVAASAFAAGLSRTYEEWGNSPQSYFMTRAERAEWKTITSDDEAQRFIANFVAKRGEGFAAEVADRAAKADQYLTVAKTRGSQTLRGKMVILLGPPDSIAAKPKKVAGDVRATPDGAMNALGGGGRGGGNGASAGDVAGAAQSPGNNTVTLTEYTYTYAANRLPAAWGKPLVVTIDVKPVGTDDLFGFGLQRELDDVYEMAAQERLAKAAAPAPQPEP